MLVVAVVLATGRDERIAERRQARNGLKEDKVPPRRQQALNKGSPRTTFVVGALPTLPGASYLAGLGLARSAKQKLSTNATVRGVITFDPNMPMLLELPLARPYVRPGLDFRRRRASQGLGWSDRRADRSDCTRRARRLTDHQTGTIELMSCRRSAPAKPQSLWPVAPPARGGPRRFIRTG